MDEPKGGALRGELQLKIFILFILRHFDRPLPSEMLTDLSMDRVADRLEFESALGDLEQTGLVVRSQLPEGLSVTPVGLQTLDAVENELPAATRSRAVTDIEAARLELRRRAEVGTRIDRDGDSYRVTLIIGADGKTALELNLLFPSEDSASRAARAWQKNAHVIYKELLSRLS